MTNSVTNKDLYDAVNGFRLEARSEYVTKDEFRPVKNVVYGTAAMILVAFFTAVIAWIMPAIRHTTPQVQASSPPTSSVSSSSTTSTSPPTTPAANPAISPPPSSGSLLNGILKQVAL